jgi:biopolymer transport protein ExbD
MRTPNYNTRFDDRQDVTMTPMIDVVFLLLIFFICTASFQIVEQNLPSRVQLEFPPGAEPIPANEQIEDVDAVIVKIGWLNDEPTWGLNSQRCPSFKTLQEKLAALSAIDSAVPVILDVLLKSP